MIYCNSCKFFVWAKGSGGYFCCLCEIRDTPRGRTYIRKHEDCGEQNAKNDCPDYENEISAPLEKSILSSFMSRLREAFSFEYIDPHEDHPQNASRILSSPAKKNNHSKDEYTAVDLMTKKRREQ